MSGDYTRLIQRSKKIIKDKEMQKRKDKVIGISEEYYQIIASIAEKHNLTMKQVADKIMFFAITNGKPEIQNAITWIPNEK